MIFFQDSKRSEYASDIINQVDNIDWGLLILDEVQCAVADKTIEGINKHIRCNVKIGLTATLLREDEAM